MREAAAVDAALSAVATLTPREDPAEVERVVSEAAAQVGKLFNAYAAHDGSGRLSAWYHASMRHLQARAVELLGAERGRVLVHVAWEPMPRTQGPPRAPGGSGLGRFRW